MSCVCISDPDPFRYVSFCRIRVHFIQRIRVAKNCGKVTYKSTKITRVFTCCVCGGCVDGVVWRGVAGVVEGGGLLSPRHLDPHVLVEVAHDEVWHVLVIPVVAAVAVIRHAVLLRVARVRWDVARVGVEAGVGRGGGGGPVLLGAVREEGGGDVGQKLVL